MAARGEAYELLQMEEADAWFEYLEATRAQSDFRYKEVEPWAWARLSQRLRAIKTKRQKLRPAAA
jgi:predicted phosphatase